MKNMEYVKYPTTVKQIANELIRVCNEYKMRKIGNEELKEIVLYYSTKFPEKLFSGSEINPTIKKIVGKKREEIINKLLEGYQQKFF